MLLPLGNSQGVPYSCRHIGELRPHLIENYEAQPNIQGCRTDARPVPGGCTFPPLADEQWRTAMRALVAAAFLVLGGSGLAAASDAIAIPVESSPVAVPVANQGFDWSGFYAGVYGVVQSSPAADTQLGLGVGAGINAKFDFFLIGGEVALQGLTNDTIDTAYGQILGRAGVVVTDDLLLYAAAGYGMGLTGPKEQDALLGGGVEFAVTDNVSLRGQYLHGFDVEGNNPKDQITLGANFHF
jgi:outer membrane immunogenic protein